MTEEHRALRDAVRGLLSGYSTRVAVEQEAGFDAGLWQRLCKEIGVAGLAVPESYGGAGASLLESVVVLAEWGRALTPGPMLGCGVLATQVLLRAGDAEACERLLPGICAGDRIAALAWQGDVSADGGRLTGEAQQVLDAEAAEVLLVVAGGALWEVDISEVTVQAADVLDSTRRLALVGLADVPGRRVGGDDGLGPWLRDLACVALSAEQVGAAAKAFEATHEYVQQRVQFGRPIGSFQVLQHRLAEAYLRLEAATTASWTAAEAFVAGSPSASTLAGMAKVYCSEALQAVAAEMVQMHGGLAITWEHDAHLYLRRSYASAQLFGSPAFYLDRLGSALLAG
ncbi:acyl-CoA dehydrogenase family protein [Paractinoplanes durhamensis]|uniref:acyl-CoA dehydrogenase family protein n=1 Tax=Paractinoplanes durhamensis TaxID=113563 RepID=UPI00194155C3|nr:acyl-CoA dehydrogenase family protein [Actinoplanes durhamensis]